MEADSNISPSAEAARFLPGGEMAELIRRKDWSRTPLGPVESWSQSLRMMVGFLLANRFPLLLWWGAQYISIYNDAYRPILGAKHPRSLGQPVSECWSEIWHILKPLIDTPFAGGPATWMEDLPLEINRYGFVEETHFTIAYSPVPDETAPRGIGGVLATVHEITEKVVGERRIAALRDLGARSAEAKTAEEACVIAAEMLANYPKDVPFALFYLVDRDGEHAQLVAATGAGMGEAASPLVVELGENSERDCVWPLAKAVRREAMITIEDLAARFANAPPGPWSDPPSCAVVAPIRSNAAGQLAGLLVAGVSPRLRLDEQYRSFFELAASQVATAVANARAYEEERKRAEALAGIDRAKTAFFSNVSHEFRTPLTLMLGPLEDALASPDLPALERQRLAVAHRNALRLLKLVNTLLDFSRIEAGRARAVYETVDLAALTAELASNFRSACERAGLLLVIDCPPLPGPVHVDRDMWEKIVLNLLSNAFKFTFAGEITVSLRAVDGQAEMMVRDTGVGVPEHELPRLFERFHRIEGQQSRTYEGSGIGLALVQELVRLHGGTIRAESALGRGTSFIVGIPLGTAHLPPEQVGAERHLASTSTRAEAYVEEALRWLPDRTAPAVAGPSGIDEPGDMPPPHDGARVLVADDNADMRAYLHRLLGRRCAVETVADGEAALAALRARRPDLVLADVMMPNLDGSGLLRAIRADAALRDLPVIMLSAHAGEEARVEGLGAGADDYLVKPFSARELIARVAANLELSRVRRDAMTAVRDSERRTRELFRQAPGVMAFLRGPNHVFEFANDAYLRLVGDRDFLGKPVREVLPEIEGQGFFELLDRVYRTGEPFIGSETPIRLRRKPDSPPERIFMDFLYQPITDAAGAVTGIFVEGFDVTARKEAEERQRLLLDELNHRVKNTLAAVQSIASQTLRGADIDGRVRDAFEGRLMALAQAHDLLTQGRWEGAMLRDLALQELSPYGAEDGVRFTIAGPNVRLRPKVALALGMVFHELATNAAKYGAFSNGTGRVRLAWKVADAPPSAMLRLRWSESGGPSVAKPRRQGFGSRLIERGLAHELNGEVQLRYDPSGVVCTMDLPLTTERGGGEPCPLTQAPAVVSRRASSLPRTT
jgi:signal transduction histidine kinase/CheY-like chemotaxis protein